MLPRSVPISRFLDRWDLEYKPVGNGEMLFKCPWRHHRSGQWKVYINLNSGMWHCKACPDRRGNLTQLVALMHDISISEANAYLIDQLEETDYDTFGPYISNILDDTEHRSLYGKSEKELSRETKRLLGRCVSIKKSVPFWKNMGVHEKEVRHYGLRYRYMDKYPYVIPVVMGGVPRYYVVRSRSPDILPKYLYQKGFPKSDVIFGIDPFVSVRTLVLCEGSLDAVAIRESLRVYGSLDDYAVGAVLGSSLSKGQKSIVEGICDDVVTFFDNDPPGIGLTESAKRMLSRLLVRSVRYPENTEGSDPRALRTEQRFEMIQAASFL